MVCNNNTKFIMGIGAGYYYLGIEVHDWGLRIMLIWWHICVHAR